jgi:hypothetical protein
VVRDDARLPRRHRPEIDPIEIAIVRSPRSQGLADSRPAARDLALQLDAHPRIALKQTEPTGVGEPLKLLAEDAGIAVVLLVCLEAEIAATLGRLRSVRPALPVACVPIDQSALTIRAPKPPPPA